jgi:hypothetical protein
VLFAIGWQIPSTADCGAGQYGAGHGPGFMLVALLAGLAAAVAALCAAITGRGGVRLAGSAVVLCALPLLFVGLVITSLAASPCAFY